MPDENEFKVSDYNRIIDDVMNEFFEQRDLDFDLKELMKVQMLGSPEEQLPQTGLEGEV